MKSIKKNKKEKKRKNKKNLTPLSPHAKMGAMAGNNNAGSKMMDEQEAERVAHAAWQEEKDATAKHDLDAATTRAESAEEELISEREEREREIGILQRAVDRRNKAIDEYWKPYVERVKGELAHCEALLIDCQKAHDVTIAGQDALFAENMRVRKQRDEANNTIMDLRELFGLSCDICLLDYMGEYKKSHEDAWAQIDELKTKP